MAYLFPFSFFILIAFLSNDLPLQCQLQMSTRHRNSIVAGSYQLNRHRTNSLGARKRSDSEKTEKADADIDDLNHPVEPRKLTAQLPPIMVYFSSLKNGQPFVRLRYCLYDSLKRLEKTRFRGLGFRKIGSSHHLLKVGSPCSSAVQPR